MSRFTGKYAEKRYEFGKSPDHGGPPDRAELLSGDLWLFVEDGVVVAVDLRCPCGCGSQCYTPVRDATKGKEKDKHSWLYSRGPNGVTITPSIRYTSGCKAHFNITDGRAEFHGDSGK